METRQIAITDVTRMFPVTLSLTFTRFSDVDGPARNQRPDLHTNLPTTRTRLDANTLCIICAGGLATLLWVLIGLVMIIPHERD